MDMLRQRRRQPGVVQHDRARHRADHAAAVHDDLHRRRPGAVRPGQAASARQRRVRAQDSALCRTSAARSICRLPIRSMTSLPASVFGLKDRGVLRPGAWADMLIFDPAKVRDAATYLEPHQMSEGHGLRARERRDREGRECVHRQARRTRGDAGQTIDRRVPSPRHHRVLEQRARARRGGGPRRQLRHAVLRQRAFDQRRECRTTSSRSPSGRSASSAAA